MNVKLGWPIRTLWRARYLVGMLLLSTGAKALTQDRAGLHPRTVRAEVSRIETDRDPQSRYEATSRLVTDLRNHSSFIVAEDVAALAELLRDSNDVVQDRAAVALGLIGPRAARSVPALRTALRTALDEVACVRADQNSSFAIAIALRRIGVAPHPPDCIATPGYGLKPRLDGRRKRDVQRL